MSFIKKIISLILLIFISFSNFAHAQEKEPKQTLRVAIKPSEPWVMYDTQLPIEKRNPIGFSIDLWQGIAHKIGVKTEWIYEKTVIDLLNAVQTGDADVGISAITIRSDREQLVDFSTSMFELGLQIMVKAEPGVATPFKILITEVSKLLTFQNIIIFVIVLFCAINLRWWADRLDTYGPQLFPERYWPGLGEAFWWSITMLITWEVPRSKGFARVVDLTWHFTGLVAMSILTGIIAASLTIQAVGGAIKNERDLPGKRVAAVATDAPRDYLEKLGARVVPVENLDDGIEMVLKGEVDALVHDGPRLLYLAERTNRKHKPGVLVLPAVFNHQNYGIVLPNGSEYLEEMNWALLKLREPEGLEKSFHARLKEKWIPRTD